jgi:curli biogenesis system outer membrane secretion channel CsgG
MQYTIRKQREFSFNRRENNVGVLSNEDIGTVFEYEVETESGRTLGFEFYVGLVARSTTSITQDKIELLMNEKIQEIVDLQESHIKYSFDYDNFDFINIVYETIRR